MINEGFLSDREQFISGISVKDKIKREAPQQSFLRPILFAVLTNDRLDYLAST